MSAPDVAMVLAAGRGTRMRPFTDHTPKPMIPVLGRPLIDRTLDRLHEAGVSRAVVNLHHLGARLRDHLAMRQAPTVSFSDESDALLETGGGVVRALPLLDAPAFHVVNSDNIWFGADALAPLGAAWQDRWMDALLLLVPRGDAIGYTRAGDFTLGEDGRIARRGDAATAPYVFSGAQILTARALDGAPEGAFSLNVIWDRLIERGRAFGIVHPDRWCDVGTPDGLADAERALRDA